MSPFAAAAVKTVEVLRFNEETPRAKQALAGFASAAAGEGFRATVTHEGYRGESDWLLLWGPGAPSRFEPMRAQVAGGGHVAALDLAYWQRQEKVRVSIDAAHPQAYVMREVRYRGRLYHDHVGCRSAWDPAGPVVVAGIGRKAAVQYGASVVLDWEHEMIEACRQRWPERAVLYRRKQADAPAPAGVAQTSPLIPIDDALQGCSLVVTWHSNVAVDAIRNGIPVVCKDGAAAAVFPDSLEIGEDPVPLSEFERDVFLGNLAWFQWDPLTEAAAFWRFLREVVR